MEGGLEKRPTVGKTSAEEIYDQKDVLAKDLGDGLTMKKALTERYNALAADHDRLAHELKTVNANSAAGMGLIDEMDTIEDEMGQIAADLRQNDPALRELSQKLKEKEDEMKKHLN